MSKNYDSSSPPVGTVFGGLVFAVVLLACAVALPMWGCPQYHVYSQRQSGMAALAEAESSRQIKILEARAAHESAKELALAEVERAKGVAEANRIIGNSLKGNSEYLTYLWLHNLTEAQKGGSEVIYVPTEANLPILEATRLIGQRPTR